MSATLIAHVPLFRALPAPDLAELARSLEPAAYPARAMLFHEGDIGDRFFVVLDGTIAIIKALGSPDERLVALRGAGEFVGEMSLLSGNGLRTASARVEADAVVLTLTRADFDALLHRHPTLAYEMLRVLSTRLNASHNAAIHDLHEKNTRLEAAYAQLQAAQAQLIEQETIKRELQVARDIQESMLPQQLAALPGVALGARMVPARMVGGDFYDVIALDGERLALVIGDVSGKGVPAALFMALACSLLRAEALRTPEPEAVLRNCNRQLLSMNRHNMFVTVLFAVLDAPNRRLTYVRAGHDVPRLWHGSNPIDLPRDVGHPLALFDEPALDMQSIALPPASTLVFFTDGVTEATAVDDTFFGLEQLDRTVASLLDHAPQTICDQLIDTLIAFHAGAPQSDDITLLAARIT